MADSEESHALTRFSLLTQTGPVVTKPCHGYKVVDLHQTLMSVTARGCGADGAMKFQEKKHGVDRETVGLLTEVVIHWVVITL